MITISGFTFVRNAVMNGYPFIESIESLLPLVDEFVVAVGKSEDDTLDRVRAIDNPKIKIVETHWNEVMRDRGFVYGQQKMIAHYNCSGDWAFYLEGDEVVHEDDLEKIRRQIEAVHNDHSVEALYFDFLHFYGTANQIGIAGYRRAPRIIRNSIRVVSPDGLFFVVLDKNKKGRYPKAKFANASIYHYGHCRKVEFTRSKLQQVGKYWDADHANFQTYGNIDIAELREFNGNHPAVMVAWLDQSAEKMFVQNPEYRLSRRDRRNRLRFWIEERFGLEISKKHYKDLGV